MQDLIAIGNKVNALGILAGMILEIDLEKAAVEEVGERTEHFVCLKTMEWGWVRVSVHGRFKVLGYFNP